MTEDGEAPTGSARLRPLQPAAASAAGGHYPSVERDRHNPEKLLLNCLEKAETAIAVEGLGKTDPIISRPEGAG